MQAQRGQGHTVRVWSLSLTEGRADGAAGKQGQQNHFNRVSLLISVQALLRLFTFFCLLLSSPNSEMKISSVSIKKINR